MPLFLNLKHWHLFLLTWGLPLLAGIGIFIHIGVALTLLPLLIIVSALTVFGWISSIAICLNKHLPNGLNLNIKRFKLLFALPLIYVFLLVLWIGFIVLDESNSIEQISSAVVSTVFVPLHLLSLIIIFWGIGFAARTLKCVEKNQSLKFDQYTEEFFLIWFSFVGFWILQPRLNKLMDQY